MEASLQTEGIAAGIYIVQVTEKEVVFKEVVRSNTPKPGENQQITRNEYDGVPQDIAQVLLA